MRTARLALLIALFSAGIDAASVRTLRPEIPFAFEENRGQSPADFRYVLVHQNAGFSCHGVTARDWSPFRPPLQLTFVGAQAGCDSVVSDPLPSYSNFYRGAAMSASAENVRHYATIRFRNVWPGVDVRYNAVSSGYTITVLASSGTSLAQVRFSGLGSGMWLDPNGNVGSPVATFAMAGPVQPRVSDDRREVRFATTVSTGPVTFTLTTTNLSRTLVQSRTFAVDPEGAMYFASDTNTYSELDPASTRCFQSSRFISCPDVYVAKFDSSGALQFLIYLRGDGGDSATQIESDAGGNIYVAGTTASSDFVTTAGAYQERRQASVNNAFLSKLHGPTGGLIYSTLFGGSIGVGVSAMGVDVFGRTYLGLFTGSQDLPRKGPQAEETPTCSTSALPPVSTTCSWIVFLDDGRELVYSQQSSSARIVVSRYGSVYYNTWTALSPDGSRFATAQYALWSDGSLRYRRPLENEPEFSRPGPDESLWGVRIVRDESSRWVRSELVRLGPGGEGPEVVKTDLPASVQIAAVDLRNQVWVYGDVPLTPDAPLRECGRCGGVAVLDAAGNTLFGTKLPGDVNVDRFRVVNGVLYAAAYFASPGAPTVAIVDRSAAPAPVLASILDVDPRGFSLVPGNVLALTGALIGPATPVHRPLDGNGRLATEVDGYRVLFDDYAAPIWAASEDRLVVQVPLKAAEWSTVTIEHNGKPLVARSVAGTSARWPVILAGGPTLPDDGFVIRNEDGTANTADNPAVLGSVVSFLVAGVGQTDPPLVEGELRHSVLAKPKVTPAVSFSLGEPDAEVISYHQARDYPAGIMEMKVRLPQKAPGTSPSWSLFLVDPVSRFPVTSQLPLSIYIRS
jgi:uncharacterized protein (TIGR03437 family)